MSSKSNRITTSEERAKRHQATPATTRSKKRAAAVLDNSPTSVKVQDGAPKKSRINAETDNEANLDDIFPGEDSPLTDWADLDEQEGAVDVPHKSEKSNFSCEADEEDNALDDPKGTLYAVPSVELKAQDDTPDTPKVPLKTAASVELSKSGSALDAQPVSPLELNKQDSTVEPVASLEVGIPASAVDLAEKPIESTPGADERGHYEGIFTMLGLKQNPVEPSTPTGRYSRNNGGYSLASPFTPVPPTPYGTPSVSLTDIAAMQAQMAHMAAIIEGLKNSTQQPPLTAQATIVPPLPQMVLPTPASRMTLPSIPSPAVMPATPTPRGMPSLAQVSSSFYATPGVQNGPSPDQDEQIAAMSDDNSRVVATIFRNLSNQDVPFGDGYMNLSKLQEVLPSLQYGSVRRGDLFSSVRPCFINMALYQSARLSLDGRNRIIHKLDKDSASQVVISIMVGGVQSCDLIDGVAQFDHTVKKITITPTDLTMTCFRQTIRKVFKRPAVRVPFETDTEISFSTKRSGAKSFGTPKKKSSRMYGSTRSTDAVGQRRDLRAGRTWAELANQMSVIDFEGEVPIYNATESGFAFDDQAFASLNNLPRSYEDIAENSIVAVGFTTNLWGLNGTGPPCISLNVQFVIILAPPPVLSDSD